MQEKCAAAIAQALQEVPEGTFAFLRHDNPDPPRAATWSTS